MTADEFFDAPTTPGRKSKWEQWGYHYFIDGLQKANVDFLEPNKDQAGIVRVAGRPVLDEQGRLLDIMPFLRPRPSRKLSDPVDKLFAPTVCYQIRVARYMGPRPDFDEETNKRLGPPQLHFIDEYPPHVRRKYVSEGRQLPPTCLDILLAKAPSVVARYEKYAKYFKADDDFHSALKRPTNVWFLNGLCLNHGKVDCDEENPLPCLHLLTWTAYKSMMDLVLEENEGYEYPEGADHEKIAARAELNKRFKVNDLTDPSGAKALAFTFHKQKRKSSKGGKRGDKKMEGSRYETSLTDAEYPFDAELQAKMWTPPQEIFWYPTPQQAFELMLNNAGEEDWEDFLYLLAKGTDLEAPERVRGADMEPSVDPQREAAPAAAPEPEAATSEAYQQDEAEEAQAAVVDEAPPKPAQPAQGAKKSLGLGADFGKRKPGDPQLNEAEKAENDDIPPPDMPLPEPSQVFGDSGTQASDVPESVKERTEAAKERLARIRGEKK